ncbi:MAG: 50S ribosomal protein L18 [Minisyncoccia bacterium]|jgi:large subunit ribosomal protein L18
MAKNQSNQIKSRREKRVRLRIRAVTRRPRLSVFRSNTNIYAQIIDDANGKTMVSASSLELKGKKSKKSDIAKEVGKKLAEKAVKAGIKDAAFDRGRYRYHGRVKALAEGAREGGLTI